MLRAAAAARKSCGVHIPRKESSVHPQPVERQPLKVTLPFPWDFLLHVALVCDEMLKVKDTEFGIKTLGLRSSVEDRGWNQGLGILCGLQSMGHYTARSL